VSEYASISAAARALGIGRDRIRAWIAAGKVRPLRYGRTVRVRLAELEAIGLEPARPETVDVREIARRSLR
jgi:excisionase family DNA binding protein